MNFGDKIEITHILRRNESYEKHPKAEFPHHVYFKKWKPIPFSHGSAIVIGKRTLFNGYNVYDHETGNIFHPTESFQA